MSFLSPLFLFGALAAAIPIALHLLKREPEVRVRFAAVRLLRHAPVEHTRRRRLRELLLLAVRVAALLLLAAAFARPFFASGAALDSGGVLIVALDTSLSLSAPGVFERARQLAKEAISRAPSRDLVGVVTFAGDAHVAAAPSTDRALALSAVDRAAAGYGATRYRAALNQAAAILDGRRGTIVVVTDLQESGWDAGDRARVPESARIEVADVGAPPPNLAVTAVRSVNNRIVATVRNAGSAPREVKVHLSVDDHPGGEAAAAIGANQSADVVLPGARGTMAAVSVDDRDGVQADNVRYLVLDNSSRPTVLVVTTTGDLGRDAFYVQHALTAAGSDGAAYEVAGAGAGSLTAGDRTQLAGSAAVLLLSTRGLERRGRERLMEYVRQGGGLIIAAGPNVDGEVAADTLNRMVTVASPSQDRTPAGPPHVFAPADLRHPVFEAFGSGAASLALVRFERVATIRGPACQTLARFTTGEAALLECELGEGRVFVVASDLDNGWNDFPRHAMFVPFLHEAVRYVSGAHARSTQYLVGSTPPGIPETPGVTAMPAAEGGQVRRVAVNVDPVESDPGRLTVKEFQAAVTRLQDTARVEGQVNSRHEEDRQHLWQYVLGMMLVVLLVESIVSARTA
jgi:hypothetical protein